MKLSDYSYSIIASNEKNKTSSAIAREINLNQSSISRFLKNVDISSIDLKKTIIDVFGNKKINVIIDDTIINKNHSKETEGVSIIYDNSNKAFSKGICITTVGLTDGKYFLPIDLEQWIAKDLAGEKYLTKIQIAMKLILKIIDLKLNINCFIFDGLYFSKNFLNFLNFNNLKFLIKCRNTTVIETNNGKTNLKNCKDLKLNSNQKYKKVLAKFMEKNFYFIKSKRENKNSENVIFLIANFKTKAKEYTKIYSYRWTIEKFFRTAKQSLGFNDSYSCNSKIYLNHIKCVFFSYSTLQFICKKFKFKSVEDALIHSQARKSKLKFIINSLLYS